MLTVRKIFANLFRFSGRLDRRSFWLMSLILIGLYILLYVFWVPIVERLSQPSSGPIGIAEIGSEGFSLITILILLAGLFLVVMVWVSAISLIIRRLHDRNQSGWWALPIVAVALIIDFELLEGPVWTWVFPALLLLGGAGIVYFVDIGLLKGTSGVNKYGPDPTSVGPADPDIFGQ